uniref:Ig-like domain-containing protein n=1 Tax=Strix occidentalis caurina TaxID=311401 RepID=A0A8D0KXS9_STROC
MTMGVAPSPPPEHLHPPLAPPQVPPLNQLLQRGPSPPPPHREGLLLTPTFSIPPHPTVCEASSRPIPPEVQVFHATTCSSTGEEMVELVCFITGFTPATVEIEWLVDGVRGLLVATQTSPCPDEGANTYSATSRTNVSSVDWLEGKTFTCQVKHLASGTIMQDHARFCQDTPSANRIVLYVLPPTLVDLYINHEPKLRCLATNLPSDSDLQVSWSKETPGGLQPDLLDLREQFNGTFTATSTVAISSQQWEAGERFTCTVHHRDLPTPLHRSISRSTGKPSPPHVYLFAPHPDEMSQDTLTLTCLVYGFYPVDVQVQWLKNHQNVPEEDYVTTPPLKDGPKGSTFFVVSKMAVAKADWERGGPFVCMVLHEGLSMKFTQRQVQRSPGN